MIRALTAAVRNFGSAFLIAGVRAYQMLLRPILPSLCRFEPSCSEYFIGAVRKHGPVRGACKGVYRLCRCNPWNRGGYDPP
jgi:putative membrane protein insertion efficiency factor